MNEKIAIVSDAHLGYRQYGRVDREDDFENAFINVIDQCIQHKVTTIVAAGDMINVKRPSSRTILTLVKIEKKLKKHNIHMHFLQGNHDYSKPSWSEILDEAIVDSYIHCLDNKLLTTESGITIYGYPEFSKMDFINNITHIPKCDILLCHTPVKEFIKYPSDSAIAIDQDLPLGNHKYIFIGDTHVNQEEPREVDNHKCIVISPGSTEMNKSDEPINKFFYIIENNKGSLIHNKIAIVNRLKLFFTIDTEKELDDAINLIKAHKKAKPVIYGYFLNTLDNAALRLNIVITEDMVNNLKPKTLGKPTQFSKTTNQPYLKKPVDYIADLIKPEDIIHGLAVKIISCGDNDVTTDITEFITTYRKNKLDLTTN